MARTDLSWKEWMAAMIRLGRLKFLMCSPITFVLGAAFAALHGGSDLNVRMTLVGLLFVWVCHAMTHYYNEYSDFDTDSNHVNPSPWTGGSRVLVEGLISRKTCLRCAHVLTAVAFVVLFFLHQATSASVVQVGLLSMFFSIAYSVQPIRLSTRGLGEATVVIVLNILSPLFGYHLQSNASSLLDVPQHFWVVIAPSCLVEYVRMMVMNMADIDADRSTKKHTLPVRIGLQRAQQIHNIGMTSAYFLICAQLWSSAIPMLHGLLLLLTVPSALWLMQNVPALPWVYENPFWASMHNIAVKLLTLVAVLATERRGKLALSFTSWLLLAMPLGVVITFVPGLIRAMAKASQKNVAKQVDSTTSINNKSADKMKKRVVIIGGGPCGLAALKETLAGGHEATLYERSDKIGGVFASAACYPNLHLTISNWAMAFSDFPDTQRLCYSSADDYLRYLQAYVRHFDLEKHIRYNSEIVSATRVEGGNNRVWSLEIVEKNNNNKATMQVDALIVATGSNQIKQPIPREFSSFKGSIIHSAEYNAEFKRKVEAQKLKVLVVGSGESAADISAELGDVSPDVTVWLRRAPMIAPRYLSTKAEVDLIAMNKVTDFPANAFLEAITTNRMSSVHQSTFLYGFFRRFLWHSGFVNSTLSQLCLQSATGAYFQNDQTSFATKNARMSEALHAKKIKMVICPTVSVEESSCTFNTYGGSVRQEFDAIVLCHGFKMDFSWLKEPNIPYHPRAWFLHCFPAGLGDCLFFVGYARPHQGGIPQMAEMLSRYIALILRGERALPPDYATLALQNEVAARDYYWKTPNLHTLVDYNAFMESVARRIGCEPRLPFACVVLYNVHMLAVACLLLSVFSLSPLGLLPAFLSWIGTILGFVLVDDGVMIKWWFYPSWSMWYRQRGPGAVPNIVESVLGRVSLGKSTDLCLPFCCYVLYSVLGLYLQRMVSFLLFIPDLVLDMLGLSFSRAWGGLFRPKFVVLHHCPWRFSDLFLP